MVRSVDGTLDMESTEIFERDTRRLTSCQTTVRQINCELWTCCSIFLWSAASQLHNVCGNVAISQFTVRRRGCYLWQLLMIASSDRRGRIQGGKTAAERQRRSRRMSWSCCCCPSCDHFVLSVPLLERQPDHERVRKKDRRREGARANRERTRENSNF